MGEQFEGGSRSRVIYLGLLTTLVSVVLFVLSVRASRLLGMTPIAPFSLPSPTIDVALVPQQSVFDSPNAIETWSQQLVVGLLHALVVLAYYSGLAGLVLGIFAILGVSGVTRDRTAVVRAVQRLVGDSVVRTVLLFVVVVWTIIFNPWVWPIALELFIIVTVGGVTFALLAALTLEVYRREEPAVRVLVAYPLAIGTLVLPLVAAGLASPTFARFLQGATTALAVFLLDNVFAVVGLASVLRQQFRLAGIAYFVTWVGVILVLGWLTGAGVLASRRLRERKRVR